LLSQGGVLTIHRYNNFDDRDAFITGRLLFFIRLNATRQIGTWADLNGAG
jgi:hypothetical protein